MTSFVTVGLQRIQSHLSRSRHLWGRRGASEQLALLTTLPRDVAGDTSSLVVQQVLDANPKARECKEALDIDGLVVFESADADAALAAGRELAGRVMALLPASTLEVRRYEADSYAATHDTTPAEREVWTPRQPDYPPIRLCDECAQGSAIVKKSVSDEDLHLCQDCCSRWPDTSRRKTVVRLRVANPNSFTAEYALLASLRKTRQDLRGANDFDELAGLRWDPEGPTNRTTVDNHLALIFADGNGMGALFESAWTEAKEVGSTLGILDTSKKIKTATFRALEESTEHMLKPDDRVLPAIPHIFGGDDVLVSVPADRAWPFLSSFLNSVKEGYAGLPHDPSISAGMVICREKYPIGDQVELAERLMRLAKEKVNGTGWSFLWTDVTADGPQPVRGREPWTLKDLEQRRAALDHIVAQGNSAWASVLECLARPDHAALNLWRLGKDHRPVGVLLQKLGIPSDQIPSAAHLSLVADTLSLARWWH